MSPLPLKSGHERLDRDVRTGINFVCKQVMHAWELEKDPCDLMDLLVVLNAAAARAQREIEKLHADGKDDVSA